MFLVLLHGVHAQDAPCLPEEITAYIDAVEQTHSREAYLCLATLDEAGGALLEQVTRAPEPSTQLTRALAIHWMQRLDQPFPHDVARALPAVDRRLLSDAVKARLGRQSPAPEHVAVFEQFAWYTPDARYTDGRLTEQDRQNLTVLASPPAPPPPPEEPSAAEMIADVAATPATERGCAAGCATTRHRSPRLPLLAVLVGVLLWRRRAG